MTLMRNGQSSQLTWTAHRHAASWMRCTVSARYKALKPMHWHHRTALCLCRSRNAGKRNSAGSKASSSSRSKSPGTASSPAAETDLAGSPATRLSQSTSASDTPAQSADTSPIPSPAKGAGMAVDLSVAHAHACTAGGTPSPGSSTDDSKNAEGTPQATPLEHVAYAEQVQPGANAVAAREREAELQPAAAPAIISAGAERALHAPPDGALTPTLRTPSHPDEAEAAKGPALQDTPSLDSVTRTGSQPANPPVARETEIAEHAQAGQNNEIPAIGVSDTPIVLEPEDAEQAQRQDSAIEGDTYYDTFPVLATVLPPASAAASSASEVQASHSEQTEPSRAEPAQEIPFHAPAQHQEAPQEPETPSSHHASSPAEGLRQVTGSDKHTMKERRPAHAGTVQSKDAEKHVDVTLRCACGWHPMH